VNKFRHEAEYAPLYFSFAAPLALVCLIGLWELRRYVPATGTDTTPLPTSARTV
jgi:hypothetical protein